MYSPGVQWGLLGHYDALPGPRSGIQAQCSHVQRFGSVVRNRVHPHSSYPQGGSEARIHWLDPAPKFEPECDPRPNLDAGRYAAKSDTVFRGAHRKTFFFRVWFLESSGQEPACSKSLWKVQGPSPSFSRAESARSIRSTNLSAASTFRFARDTFISSFFFAKFSGEASPQKRERKKRP